MLWILQGDCPASPVAEVAPQGQGGEGEAGWMGYLSKAVAYLPAQVELLWKNHK